MTPEQAIVEKFRSLTPDKQQEALDFVEYLQTKIYQQAQPWEPGLSALEAACRIMGSVGDAPPDLSQQVQQCRVLVEQVLKDYAAFLGDDDQVRTELVFDREHDRYLLVETGWQNGDRIYGTLLHIDILDGKLWIQQDGTEEGIAEELVAAGIPKHQIVLGFKSPERRQLTEYAVS